MKSDEAPAPPASLRADARRLYGGDPIAYEAGRPDYPERVFDILAKRCGVGTDSSVLEIGPGTGRVTRRLLDVGAHVLAIEPDASLATYLGETINDPVFEVINVSFEEAPLADESYDCVASAMSFHWVDQDIGLPKLGRILRPGGYAALWWTVFRDPTRPDPFHAAVEHLLPEGAGGPHGQNTWFELDVARRRQDLADRARLEHVDSELIRWTHNMSTAETRALYASMIAVLRTPEDERDRLLNDLAATVTNQFGGTVTRPFVTAVYTARRPQ